MSYKDAQDKLFKEWKLGCDKFVSDGIVNEEEYANSKYNILYLLKEVNGGESWDLCDFLYRGGRSDSWQDLQRAIWFEYSLMPPW
jgi:hypothetical protein